MHKVGSSTRIRIPIKKVGMGSQHCLHPYRTFLCLLKVLHNIWQTSFLLQILVGTKKCAPVKLLVFEKIILRPKLILTRKIRFFLDGKFKRTFMKVSKFERHSQSIFVCEMLNYFLTLSPFLPLSLSISISLSLSLSQTQVFRKSIP